jgi:RNA polymerase sigma factor (sigma-70 family)
MEKKINDEYINVIRNNPILSKSEERKLFLNYKMKGSKEAYDKLINSNMRLVYKCSLKYSYLCNDLITLDDIFNYGLLGLMSSIESFDISLNNSFSTYAWKSVKTEIIKGISASVGKSYRVHCYERICMHEIDDFFIVNSRKPNVSELSKLTGLTPSVVSAVLRNSNPVVSLDDCISEDDNIILLDCIASDFSMQDELEKSELRSIILNILPEISSRYGERANYIALRYGIFDNEPMTLRELSEKYGVSYQAISQSLSVILKYIKKKYGYLFEDYVSSSRSFVKKN